MGEEIDIISNQAPLHIEIKVLDADYKNFDEEILQFGREEGSTIRYKLILLILVNGFGQETIK